MAAPAIDLASQDIVSGLTLGAAKATEDMLYLIKYLFAYDGGMVIRDLDPLTFILQLVTGTTDLQYMCFSDDICSGISFIGNKPAN